MLAAREQIPANIEAYRLIAEYKDNFEDNLAQRAESIARARGKLRIEVSDVESAYRELSGNNE